MLAKIWVVFIILLHYTWFDYFKVKNRKRSKEYLFLDIFALIAYVVFGKIVDLAVRGRVFANFFRIIEQYKFQLTLLIILLLFILLVAIYLTIRNFKNIRIFSHFLKNWSIEILQKHPNWIISSLLLLIMFFFVLRNFTGGNFYRFGLDQYTDSFILQGDSPWVILINFIFNLNNNVTILIYFAFIGVIYIFLKDNKTFYDYFFIFVAIGFSQFILDWEYIRLYILAIYSIFVSIGLVFVIVILSKKIDRKIIYFSFMFLLVMHLIVSNIFIQRERILPKIGIKEYIRPISENQYIAAGDYLKDKGAISIHSSSSIEYDSITAYYAKKVNAVLAQSVFIWKNMEITQESFEKIWNSFKTGQKITSFYKLKDPIYGSDYYFGRYIFNLNTRSITDRDVQKIVELTKMRFIVDSPLSEDKIEFFKSISPIKNKIYSSGNLEIYDLYYGRI